MKTKRYKICYRVCAMLGTANEFQKVNTVHDLQRLTNFKT